MREVVNHKCTRLNWIKFKLGKPIFNMGSSYMANYNNLCLVEQKRYNRNSE